MGAFWQLFSPVTVNITMSKSEFDSIEKDRIILPDPFAKDFFEVHREEWTDENKILGTIRRIDLTYMLSDKNLEQIKPFLKDSWQLIATEDASIIRPGLDDFIKNSLEQLNILKTSFQKLDDYLKSIEDNYYLRYDSIPSVVVYHGWPIELRSNSRMYSMSGFIFLHSYEKMQLIPEETVLFYNLKDKIRKQLSDKYTIANYTYVLGF